MASKTDLQLRRLVESHGYTLIRRSKHLVWRHPVSGHQLVTATSVSDRRALSNIKALIARAA